MAASANGSAGYFCQLTALEDLGLNQNQMATLLVSFGQLTAMQVLSLSQYRRTALPESFESARGPTAIGVAPEPAGNTAQELVLARSPSGCGSPPETVGSALRELWRDVVLNEIGRRENQFTVLPESFGQLTALQEVTLSQNRLNALPEALVDAMLCSSSDTARTGWCHLPVVWPACVFAGILD